MKPGGAALRPRRLVGGGRALLFLHGFNGAPETLMPVAEALHRRGWTVDMPVLPGHAGTPEAFGACRAETWLDDALAAYDRLAGEYDRPAAAGLSMGAALALHIAVHRPVPAVVALAPALALPRRRTWLLPLAAVLGMWRRAGEGDASVPGPVPRAFDRYPLAAARNLQRVMARVRSELPDLRAPLLGMQGRVDHVIPPICLDRLMAAAGSSVKQAVRLEHAYHVVTLDRDHPRVAETMHVFLDRHTPPVEKI